MVEKMNLMGSLKDTLMSIYELDEYTITELLCKFADEINNKTDLTGNHLGQWQGLDKPTLSEEGLRSTVEKNARDIESLNNNLNSINQNLSDNVNSINQNLSDNNSNIENIKNKLENLNIVNVKDYGAIGDGQTDDTQAIQNAIDSIPNGGIVYIPTGVYNYTQLRIKNDGVCLIGNHSGTSFSGSTLKCISEGDCSILVVKDSDDKLFGGGLYNLNIFGSEYEHVLYNDHITKPINNVGILIKHTSFFNMENVTVYGFGKGNCIIDGAYDGSIINCEFVYCGENGYCLELRKTSEYVDICNSMKFVNCKLEFGKNLLRVEGSRNIIFNNCKLEVGCDTSTHPIRIEDTCYEVNFNNCIFSNNENNGFMIVSYNQGTSINNCQFSNGVLEGGVGAKWVYGSYLMLNNNLFMLCKNDSIAIDIGRGSMFCNNKVLTYSNGQTQTIYADEMCIIKDNILHDYNRTSTSYMLNVDTSKNEVDSNIEYPPVR